MSEEKGAALDNCLIFEHFFDERNKIVPVAGTWSGSGGERRT